MKIYLRALEISDYEVTTKWRNDPEVTELLGGNFYYISSEREKKWIEGAIMNDSTSIRLGIVIKDSHKLIGLVNLTNIEWINRKAEFSIVLGDKDEWGKGYGQEATKEILKFGFTQRNLEKIYLTVDVLHERAIALYGKIGFKKEGLLRRDHFKNGSFRDVFVFSILKDEYYELPGI